MRGLHYPGSYAELRAWFPDDEACIDFLDWLRWPTGPVCPKCGRTATTVGAGRVWRCGGCRKRVSRTAGTIFQDTRTPLTVWFAAAWYMTADPGGVSALTMQKLLGLGSYQTAWAMLHRYRTAMVRPGREVLNGRVEVDETFIGGEEPGPRGRGALGKTLVVIAVELREPRGYGRARMSIIPNAEAQTLHTFITDNIAPGSTVITDGWSGYLGIDKVGYPHDRRSQRAAKALGEDIGKLLPGVHRIASLAKRWLLSTHQGAVHIEHLPGYLDEFCFRFNRRRSRSRGLVFYRVLQLAIGHDPVRYQQLIARSKPKTVRSAPPGNRGHPPSLDRPRARRPWRDTP